jgi:serine/threonine protein phosphatase PrpC
MDDARQFVSQLFKSHRLSVPANRKEAFEKFVQDEQNMATVNVIIQHQDALMAKWKLQDRIAEIVQQPVRIENATVGKAYEALLNFKKLKWDDVTDFSFEGLESVGLTFDKEKRLITGVPTQSGDQKLLFKFKVEGQAPDEPANEKVIVLIVNPDPRSLWKSLESNREDPYWKEDNVTVFAPLGGKHILVSSKRGRSHANVGSFREDAIAFNELENGWSLVVVADGAGSAKASRKGSAMACAGVVDYFKQDDVVKSMAEMDELLHQNQSSNDEDLQKKIKLAVYNNLGKAVVQVHKSLQQFAQEQNMALKDLSSTLIFTLFKKYDTGYAFLSFGVGDCPVAVLNKDFTEVHLMNWLDVGEFGGGTRFITMPEIFGSEKFYTRFNFKLLEDFSYLVMMTDGIYDPKFVVEAALPNIQKWQAFFADLNGDNEEKTNVELAADNKDIERQFSQWMDFWSPGNHDDRTLAIVF